MATVTQRTFAGGEFAPALYARVDQAKYSTGLRTERNFITSRHGGATNRPGTQYVCEVNDSSKTVKLLPFVFNSDQTYVLEFGNLYMRVVRSGLQQYDISATISGVTLANPCVVTSTSHGFSSGDEIYITSVVGMTELNNRNFKVVKIDVNTFSLNLMDDSTALDSRNYTPYSSAGTAQRVYEIETPYVEADLQELSIVQSADVITIAHPNYAPRELSRSGHTSWTLSTISFEPGTSRPTGADTTVGVAGSDIVRYKITAINAETFEESLGALNTTTKTITGVTKADPAVVTATSHGFNDGDTVYITGVVGMTELNKNEYEIANKTTHTFELVGVDSSSYGAWSSGGSVNQVSAVKGSAGTPTTAAPNVITWTAVDGAGEYNVYKYLNGVYGLIGIAEGTTFNDTGITPDTDETPPKPRNPFNTTGNYPSVVGIYQGRQIYGNQDNDVERNFASRSGDRKNFTIRSPLQDDDAVTFPLAGRNVNEIRHYVDLGTLIVFTSGSEWLVKGDAAGVLKPGEINAVQQSYHGSSTLPPLVIGNTVIFLQSRGFIYRDFSFQLTSDGFVGQDLTIFSAHLVDGYTIRDWTFQQVPNSIVWSARSDGTLLGLTYIKEEEMLSWHRHDFDGGTVEQVVSVPEGTEDALYLTIKRTINGETKRYIERMYQRRFGDVIDAVFMDSALTYDGRNTNTSKTMTLSGGTDWESDETLTLTCSSAEFTSADVGNVIKLTGSGADPIRFTIKGFTSATVVTGKVHKTVTSASGLRSTAVSDWEHHVDQVTGLWHLEGKSVSVFADRYVVANPNNDAYDTVTVSNGTITLAKPYGVIHVGLPYTSDLETLEIDTVDRETFMDKRQIIGDLTLYVQDTRGLWIGSETPTSDSDFKDQLYEMKLVEHEDYESPAALKTEPVEDNIPANWNRNGRVFIRQSDPVPATILAISPKGFLPYFKK